MNNTLLSYGQKAVGLSFNPSNSSEVDRVKRLFAEVIDEMVAVRGTGASEKAHLASIAITQAQTAQMWAVKALTWKD